MRPALAAFFLCLCLVGTLHADGVGAKRFLDVVDYYSTGSAQGGSCALYPDGRVACWRNPSVNRPPDPKMLRIADAVAIYGDAGNLIALRRDHTVVSLGLASAGHRVTSPRPVAQITDRVLRLVDGSAGMTCNSK